MEKICTVCGRTGHRSGNCPWGKSLGEKRQEMAKRRDILFELLELHPHTEEELRIKTNFQKRAVYSFLVENLKAKRIEFVGHGKRKENATGPAPSVYFAIKGTRPVEPTRTHRIDRKDRIVEAQRPTERHTGLLEDVWFGRTVSLESCWKPLG